jgi:hypothetical protein
VDRSSRSAAATLMAGIGLLVPAAVGLLASGVPTTVCSFPALTVLPAFLLSDIHLSMLAVASPMLLFFIWNPALFRGETTVPTRSYVLLAVATVLSIFYFVFGWKLGVQYQGVHYTRVVGAVNIGWSAFLILGFFRSRKGVTSFGFNLFLHWMTFAWLAWYAFPYLGELP